MLPTVLGNDYLRFHALVVKYWPDPATRPKIIGARASLLCPFVVFLISYSAGPDSGINAPLLESLWTPFLQIAGPVLDAVTYHMYLGYGGTMLPAI